jgi:hypothetical protein
MSKPTFLTVCLSIACGYILATALIRTSAGQPPAPQPVRQDGQVWRYQLMQAGEGNLPTLFLTDTVTGRVWWRGGDERDDNPWHTFTSPAHQEADRTDGR